MHQIKHLLVVDDDNRIRNLLVKFLKKENYFVSATASAIEAREKLNNHVFDLIILDVMMPGETGIEFTKWLRSRSKVPVLMLTAMGDVEDIIIGLDSGADDYLPKPFDPRELIARIRRMVKRSDETSKNINIIKFGQKKYNLQNKTICEDSTTTTLSENEYLLLELLIENKNNVVTRESLSEFFDGISERSVDVQINRLRSKIEHNPKNPVFLKAVRGKGYMLNI